MKYVNLPPPPTKKNIAAAKSHIAAKRTAIDEQNVGGCMYLYMYIYNTARCSFIYWEDAILQREGIFGEEGGWAERKQTQAPILPGAIRRGPESTHSVESFPPGPIHLH